MIDTATETDIPALARLLQDLNAQHGPHLPHRFHDMGHAAVRQAVLSDAMAPGARLLVYRLERVPFAYLMWQRHPPGHPALVHPPRVAVLDHLYVDPIRRRRGIGGRLIARFEHDIRAEGFEGWLTNLPAFNAASRALMRRAGIDPTVERPEKRFQTPHRSSSPQTMVR